ncbi:FtsK/SpoIIIE domain-containing protein [Pseudofrankia asymbiotica]|uniref:Cell division protein FtsK n=1 Tax=Pseudofrankia asymbiotica TaxID=1834516 RepID=A0A1V2IKY2_9ACTN|nr:FtsK/SpoIIIE domain-containing protein [Pseudofrankia asymbiotica]ONH33777.1 cell division protein FtsK [Pseudofrankia asymbiotica]
MTGRPSTPTAVPVTVVLSAADGAAAAPRDLDMVLAVEPSTTVAALAAGITALADESAQPGAAAPGQAAAPSWDVLAGELANAGPPARPGVVSCHIDGRWHGSESTVAEAGLVGGSRIGLGVPAVEEPPPWRAADERVRWYEVHAVGGPHAGRIWPVGPGAHDIGSAAGCAIQLDGLPARGPVLHVGHTGESWLTWPARAPGPDEPDAPATGPRRPAGTNHPTTNHPAAARLAIPHPPAMHGTDEHRLAMTTDVRADERGAARRGNQSGDTPDAMAGIGVLTPERPDRADRAGIRASDGDADGPAAGAPAARRPWPPGVDLAVGDTLLRLVDPFEPDAAVTASVDIVGRDFNRPPRIVPPLLFGRQRFPTPPTPPTRRPIPVLMMLSPMLMGVAFVWFFHSVFFLVVVLMTPLMAMANWYTDRRGGRRRHRADSARYRARRASTERVLLDAVDAERLARIQALPDPALVVLTATGPGRRLWERRRSDPDHLVLRVGTIDQPSLVEVEDPAVDGYDREVRWIVPDMPVSVDLAGRGVIGLAGRSDARYGVARWLVAQAAVLQSPRDVRVEILTDASGRDRWEWVRWLPHARPGPADGPVGAAPYAFVGTDPETVAYRVAELTALVKARTKARGSSIGTVLFREPDVVVVLDGARRLRDLPGIVPLLTEGPSVRVFAICVDADERLLPEECTAVVRADPDGLTIRQSDAPEVRGVRPDIANTAWCERVARALCPLRDVTPDESGGLPDRVRLLDLLGLAGADQDEMARRLAAAWADAPASTRFPLGSGFDSGFVLDLVRDGPHALVAGTTGAGKSELLQTLVASLAARNHPDELGFVLIDYKGGSAFHSCARLPHTLGMVTDLDEALATRALESLAAELRRREETLAAVTAKDLTHYRSLRAADPALPALGRLVIVIDEFATLVREVPDFVPGLVSLAQRGRSLGVHLVLATQRPAGAVTTDIRANTNLRIALRVTDTTESSDVLDAPDAAFISAATPGRALARLAARTSQPFQTAYVGDIYRGPAGQEPPGAWPGAAPGTRPDGGVDTAPRVPVEAAELTWNGLGRPLPFTTTVAGAGTPTADLAPTDLDVLVDAIAAAASASGDTGRSSPWLPALGTRLLLDDLLGDLATRRPAAGSVALPAVPYALEDLPAWQAQRPVLCDLGSFGHMFVIGAPRSGRSQLLRTLTGALAGTMSSADVHVYGIDAGGGALAVLAELPHCGAVVPAGDSERLGRLADRLAAEVSRRQTLLGQHSCASLDELRAALPVDQRPAHLMVLIDGWDSIAAALADHDGGRLYEILLALLREGAGVGVHLVLTSERALLAGRAAGLSDNRLLLRMTDRTDYATIHVPSRRIPPVVPAGRGWRSLNQAETQVALLADDPSGKAQADALRRIAERARVADARIPAARRPFRVAALPDSAVFADVFGQVPADGRRPLRALLGLGGDETGPLLLDFGGREHSFLVAGPPGSGRSNALATLAVSLLAGGTGLVVVTPRDSPLRRLAAHADVRLVAGPAFTGDDLTEALAGLAAGGGRRVVVLVDDIDLLGFSSPLDAPLRAIVATGRDRGIGLGYAGNGETISQSISGWIGEAKRSRQGVLLAPQSALEGDLLGTRIPHSLLRTGVRPGRGHVVDATGTLRTITIPLTVLR